MEENTTAPLKKTYYYLQQISASSDKKFFIIPFKGTEVTIGRSLDNSFIMPDLTISRHHAVFRKSLDNSWSVTNLSSSGMVLDGKLLPAHDPQPLLLNSTIQLSAGNELYLYKFACKHINSDNGRDVVKNTSSTEGPSSGSAVPATQSLVEAHDQLERRLQDSRAAYDQFLRDKMSLAQSLEQQKFDLQKKFEEEQLQLQQQMQDERQKQHAEEVQQQLAQQLQNKIKELQEKLKSDRAELEQQMQLEKTRKEELRVQQEIICEQLRQEKKVLQEALQQERARLQEQVTEKVQEAEKLLQEQLQQIQSRLQHQEDIATSMSKELEKKAEAEERLQCLETEKKELQMALEEAQQNGQQVNSLQSALEQKEKEKADLQQEMEMMEFAVTAEAKKAVFDSVEQVIDSEMQCPICNELFIKAILLNCTHTFCEYCIGCWKKKKRDCPSCRSAITSETRSLAIDNFIDKIVLSLSEEMKQNRAKTIKEREEEIAKAAETESAAKLAREAARESRGRGRARGRSSRRRRGTRSGAATADRRPPPPEVVELDSGTDSSDSVSGDEGAYYGGYGVCFICGSPGHWANGCPNRF